MNDYIKRAAMVTDRDRGITGSRWLFVLVRALAPRVAKGLLTRAEAEARMRTWCLRMCSFEQWRERHEFLVWLLGQALERESVRQELAAKRIEERLRPLLTAWAASNVLLATAHDENARSGRPFSERQVNDLAVALLPNVSNVVRGPWGRRRYGR